MRRRAPIWIVGMLPSLLSITSPIVQAGGEPPSHAAASNQFGIELYGHVRDAKGNLFFSPLSIYSALAMMHAGAGGQTANEIAAVLHLPPNSDPAKNGYANLVNALH